MARSPFLSLAIGTAAALAAPLAMALPSTTFVEQGWSKEIRELFYFTPQGSRTMPYAWFMALENANGQGMFADSAHLQGYGFIPADGPHPLNPGGLPIGFALDPHAAPKTGPDLGLTCAACHTADVTVEGRRIRLDGAPANVDFDRFYADVADAVTHTFFDAAAYERFVTRVLTAPGPTAAAELRLQFADFQSKDRRRGGDPAPGEVLGVFGTATLTGNPQSRACRSMASGRDPEFCLDIGRIWHIIGL